MTTNEKRLVGGLALGSAALTIAVLVQLLAQAKGAPAQPDPALEELRQQLRALQDDVAVLKRQAALPPLTAPVRQVQDGGSVVEARPTQLAPARYLRFDAPPGLQVEQVASGDVRVTNTNPALTGQLLTLTAYQADGGRGAVRVLVPPPSP